MAAEAMMVVELVKNVPAVMKASMAEALAHNPALTACAKPEDTHICMNSEQKWAHCGKRG
eukprot:3856862-Pleurochrysis_carterae.AAC.4